jgi:hypothetical protein
MKRLLQTVAKGARLALFPLALAIHCALAEVLPPEILITAESNDNPRLLAEDTALPGGGAASRLIAEARFGFARTTPRSDLAFEPSVRSDAYFDPADETLESTDIFLRGRGQRRWQRARLGFNADVSREKLLATDFLDPQPGDADDLPDVDDTLLGVDETRTRGVFSPYTEIQFSQRSALALDLRATGVAYDDAVGLTSRTDFTDGEVGAAYVRTLNPRTTLSTRVYGEHFSADDIGNEADTVGIEMRLARDLSSIWSIVAVAGVAQSDFNYLDDTATPVSGTNDVFVLDLGLRKRTERTRFDFDLRRRLLPDSFGFLVTRNELQTSLVRDLSPRVSGGAVLRLVESTPLNGASDTGRDYGRLGLNIEWAFIESWSLVAGYEHYYWINAAVDHEARSNSLLVGFNYRKPSR